MADEFLKSIEADGKKLLVSVFFRGRPHVLRVAKMGNSGSMILAVEEGPQIEYNLSYRYATLAPSEFEMSAFAFVISGRRQFAIVPASQETTDFFPYSENRLRQMAARLAELKS